QRGQRTSYGAAHRSDHIGGGDRAEHRRPGAADAHHGRQVGGAAESPLRCGSMRSSGTVPLAALFMLACGNSERAAPTTPTASAQPSAAAPAESSAEPPRPQKPFQVYSNCADVVMVVFAQDPKLGNPGMRSIAPSSYIEGPRENDGTQTVW